VGEEGNGEGDGDGNLIAATTNDKTQTAVV